jgi:hypothetical protein
MRVPERIEAELDRVRRRWLQRLLSIASDSVGAELLRERLTRDS